MTLAFAGCFGLAACSAWHARRAQEQPALPPSAAATHAPVPTPHVTPAPPSGAPVLGAGNVEQDKARIKQALAKNSRDALTPADVGYYLDVLQGRLQQDVAGVGIGRRGERVMLDLSARIGFVTGTAQVEPADRANLAPLAKVLAEFRMTSVSVLVAADASTGSRLAEQRAQALARYFADSGVAPKRLMVIGAGVDSDANLDPRHRAHVELQIEPIVRTTGGTK